MLFGSASVSAATVGTQTITEATAGDNAKLLASYEKLVNQYIAMLKKAKAGDPTALANYASLLAKAEKLQAQLADADLSEAELIRFNKITAKLAKAAQSL